MWMTVGDKHRFSITLADTDAARAFAALERQQASTAGR
ncbi:hypothetical protein HGR_02388 [Hylemonella gracilis ATCC 19624]|uniref:Uncharacterized protein n=1 Tax=Hylemonella gracilis ATCC 19624 TaxID=887062 RepID=F3KPW5_9BURK|nr:hypothetical protein HGR_02388 [Hylemonella gracilis ATCC 19624]